MSTDAGTRRAPSVRGSLWRHRDFLLLWSAQGISAVGSRITRTALPMAAILVAGAGAFDLGLLAVALTLPRALFAWLGGGWVDRHRRRPVLIGTDLVRAIALVAIPIAAYWSVLSLPLLYGIAAITGVATVLFDVADHVFIADLFGATNCWTPMASARPPTRSPKFRDLLSAARWSPGSRRRSRSPSTPRRSSPPRC